LTAFTFDAPCKYDIILGMDFLHRMEIEMSFRHGSITCGKRKIAMKPLNYWDHFGYWSLLFDLEEFHDSNLTHEAFLLERELLRGDIEADLLDEDTNIKSYLNDNGKPYLMADRPKRIVNAKYYAVTPQQVIDSISHLSTSQKSALKEVLENTPNCSTVSSDTTLNTRFTWKWSLTHARSIDAPAALPKQI
jgi:hypothetical protein